MSGFTPRGRRLVSLLIAFAVLLVGSDAFGRAGGGQHYSGPSYSGGGHSSSGGGGGGDLIELVFWILRLTFLYPAVMIPIWIGLILVIVYGSRSRTAGPTTSRSIRRLDEQRLRPTGSANAALAQLQSQDPSFNIDAFFERTRKVFLDIQEAWFLRDLDKVRAYMSDGVYRRFTTLLALMKLENERNALAGVQVLGARLLEITSTDAFDCISVTIRASAQDIDVPATLSDDEARKRATRASAEEFSEIWTFVRRRGTKSRAPGVDASQGKCPNCGAPFTGGAANKCAYCNAIVNSGNYDWVLSEITQPSEYLPHASNAPGLDALTRKDPDAAAELLQDRGLLLFWKWLEVQATGDATILKKLATSDGWSSVSTALRGRTSIKIPAVGGTAVAAIEADVNGFDRAHIDVRWSAAVGNRSASSPTPIRSIVTMVRSAQARTDRGAGLSNERCGQCGAPLTNSDSTKCDYCGNDLSAATREWQFESLVAYERWQRPSAGQVLRMPRTQPGAFATAGERRRLIRVMVAIVKADGVVEDSEVKLLKDCANRWRIEWRDVESMLNETEEALLGDLRPESPAEARSFLQQLVAAAQVDGRVDRRERQLIYQAAAKMQVSREDVDRMLA